MPWHLDNDGMLAKSGKNEIVECWYPSIIVFDLEDMCVADQIYGGEIFVGSNKFTLYYISNDFYLDMKGKDDYEQSIKEKGSDAALKYGDYMLKRSIFRNPPSGEDEV